MIILCSNSQGQEVIRFNSKMPYCDSNKITWKTDTLVYKRIYSEIDLYKSSFENYPYMYKYEDSKKEIHYFFIRKKDITFNKNKIEVNLYDDSNLEIQVFKMTKNLVFSFKLND